MATEGQFESAETAQQYDDKPAVSVAMAIRDVERYLPEAIEGILGQSFENFELIIVDFGSSDNSLNISSRYAAKDPRIKIHRVENCSLPEARNKASLLGQGEYIAVADADDVYLRDRLRWGVEYLERHSDVGVLGSAVEWINAKGKPLKVMRNPLENCEIQTTMVKYCVVWHSTALMRREAFEKVGGYRPAFTVSHDYDLWLRIAEHYQFANLEQVSVKYRIHAHQVSIRHLRHQMLCNLAAQVSTRARRLGQTDPLIPFTQITPELLVRLGVSEPEQQRAAAGSYRLWIDQMRLAGECAAALRAGDEFLASDSKKIGRAQLAEIHLSIAKAWLQQENTVKGFLAVCRAVITWPAITLRLWGAALRRLRSAER